MKKRTISTTTLLFTSVSTIIGSGWLFAAYYAAMQTGVASLLSWIIGFLAIMIVAFTYAELSAFVPVTGVGTRVVRYTHGQFVGFMLAWIIWASYVSTMSIEVQAILQYGSFFFPGLVYPTGALTGQGYFFATLMMLLISILNFYSLKWLLSCNNFLAILKIIIPIAVVLVIIVACLPTVHGGLSHMTFAPNGLKGVLAAISTGGVVYTFNGFRHATEMAGEAKDPHKSLPIALIGSLLICLVLYVALQYAFLISMGSDAKLAQWQAMKFSTMMSPFSVLLHENKLDAFLPLLYVGAIIGPFAAGLMFGSSGARTLYAMSKNGSIPAWFAQLTPKGLPARAVIFNFILGMVFFLPFPGWESMASFLTSLMAITYIMAPLGVLTLREHLQDHPRFFKLPFARAWCFVAFYICSLLFYWTGWDVLKKLLVMLLIGLVMLVAYRFYAHKDKVFDLDWQPSLWLWAFFIGEAIVSHLGTFGGLGVLSFGYDFIALALVSMISLWFAVKFTMPPAQMQKDIDGLIAGH
jgi:amino acid transporter